MPGLGVDRAVWVELEAPEFPSAALGVVVVCDEEVFFVGADEDAVGAVDGGTVEDPVYGAISINAVDPFDGGA